MTLKRSFDIAGAVVVAVLTAPVWLAGAFAVKIGSKGRVLHRAMRVGKDGATFVLYKFRTMQPGADEQGPGITRPGDPRITRVGSVLRRTKVDELPQLVNVLRGEMSLVGPRPEDPRYVALYSDAQRRVLTVRPGLTSPASLLYGAEECLLAAEVDAERAYVERILPAKLLLDLEYVDGRSFWLDLAVLLRTFGAVLRRHDRDA